MAVAVVVVVVVVVVRVVREVWEIAGEVLLHYFDHVAAVVVNWGLDSLLCSCSDSAPPKSGAPPQEEAASQN